MDFSGKSFQHHEHKQTYYITAKSEDDKQGENVPFDDALWKLGEKEFLMISLLHFKKSI